MKTRCGECWGTVFQVQNTVPPGGGGVRTREWGAATAEPACEHPTTRAAAVGGGRRPRRRSGCGLGEGGRPRRRRRRRRRRLQASPGEAGRRGRGMGPRACIPLPAPAPTVELEVADALALSVSGRGAAEAAPQGFTLAARRPPAAGEGHRQQPQASHPPPARDLRPGPNSQRPLSPRRQPGVGAEGAGPAPRARPPQTDSLCGGCLHHEPRPPTNQRLKWAGRAEARVPSLFSLLASSRLFMETQKDVASGYGKRISLRLGA